MPAVFESTSCSPVDLFTVVMCQHAFLIVVRVGAKWNKCSRKITLCVLVSFPDQNETNFMRGTFRDVFLVI